MKRMKRMMKRLALGVLTLLTMLLCIVGATCTVEPVSIVLLEQFYRPEVVLNRQFDVLEVVENYNKKYTYKIEECFYLDNLDDLERYDIPVVEDTKFTQTQPFDVHVVLTATQGWQKADLEFTLKLVIAENDMQAEMITSWCEVGVSKRINGNPDFTLVGEESSVKVSYLGTNQPSEENGVNVGSFVCNSAAASFTKWDNVVMTFSVYNPQDFDIQLGWLATKGRIMYNNIGHMQDAVVLSAGEWTKVDWSLHRVGLNWDFTTGSRNDVITIYFKMRIMNASGMSSPYQYTLYFGGLDLADYSPERFPNLETRTNEEIWAEMSGDEEDKWLGGNYTQNGKEISKWFTTDLTVGVKEYAENQTAPVENSTSYIEYAMKATALNKSGYTANIFDFTSEKPIHAALYRTCVDENWEDAYIRFWAYNNTPNVVCELRAMDVNMSGELITTLPYGEWTYVSVSLRDYYGIKEDIFKTAGYELKMYVNYTNTGCHTEETYMNLATSLLIDGFSIESEPVLPTYSGDNAWVKDNYTSKGTDISQYFRTTLSVEEKENMENLTGISSCLEYTLTATGEASWQYVGNFLDFSTEHPLDSEIYEKYKYIDWSNAYITFWAYNANSTEGETCKIFAADIVNSIYNNTIAELPYGKWTKVMVSLKDCYGIDSDPFASGEYDIKIFLQIAHSGYDSENYENFTAALYLTGVEFYAPDENEMLSDNYTANSSSISKYFPSSLKAEVKTFEAFESKPFNEATTYIKYTLKATSSASFQYVGNFLDLSASNPLDNALYEKYKNVDWNNAYITFWAYNNYNVQGEKCYIFAKQETEYASNRVIELVYGKWTKVSISLKDFYDITSDPFVDDGYNIKLFIQIAHGGYDLDQAQTFVATFYMTGFEIITPTLEDMVSSNYSPDTFAISKYERGALSTQVKDFGTVSVPEGTSYDSYIDYTMSGGDQGAKGNCTFATNFINFSAYTGTANTQVTNPISADLYARYKDIDWTNAYISFYLYNGTGLELTLYGTDNDFGGGEPNNSTEKYYEEEVIQKISASVGWTKVSISLADYCGITSDVIATGNYNIKIWLSLTDSSASGKTAAEVEAMTWSFYITGFEFASGI